jgi:hypothetical protein
VIWQTQNTPTRATLLVGSAPDNMNLRSVEVKDMKTVHFVTESDLAPGTRYYFKVIAVDGQGRKLESNVISKRTKD